jgi:hypothetical protein
MSSVPTVLTKLSELPGRLSGIPVTVKGVEGFCQKVALTDRPVHSGMQLWIITGMMILGHLLAINCPGESPPNIDTIFPTLMLTGVHSSTSGDESEHSELVEVSSCLVFFLDLVDPMSLVWLLCGWPCGPTLVTIGQRTADN